MSRPQEHIQSDLSVAYFRAIVAHSGFCISQPNEGSDYGVDCTVKRVTKFNGAFVDAGAVFDAQIKSRCEEPKGKTHISYALQVDAYNRLIAPSTTTKVLIVFFLPKEYKEWVGSDESTLSVRRAAYWFRASDLPPLKDQKDNITIKIPRENLLTVKAIAELAKPAIEEIDGIEG